MGKKTKQRTPTQLKRKYKSISKLCFGGQFLSVAAPFVTIGIVNYDRYFVQYNGAKMSIAAMMAACIMGLAIWLVAKKKFTNSYTALIIGWATFTGVFFLMGQIITDLAYIMLFGLIGILGAQGLDIASAKADAKAEKIQKAIESAEQELIKDAYIDEVNEKNENDKKREKKVRF